MTLTLQQMNAVQHGEAVHITVDQTECIVMRKDVFQKIREVPYEDSDWSDEELESVAAQMFDALDSAEKIP